LGEIDVLNAQPDALADPQAAAIEHLGHQLVGTCKTGKEGDDFTLREDRGQVSGALGSHRLQVEIQRLKKDMFVQEGDGVECLVLSGGGDIALNGEVSQESFDFGLPELGRVALVVKEDEAPDPVDVSPFGAESVMFALQDVVQTIEKLGLGPGHESPPACLAGGTRVW
jgi:hypothetical protein